jgi:hypothetical protein
MHEHMCKSPESVVDVQINLFLIAFSENGISYFLYGDFKIGFGGIFTKLILVLAWAAFMLLVVDFRLHDYLRMRGIKLVDRLLCCILRG